ncbi:MAG: S8 family serine peptidase, partial [Planctomycetota bacterium]
PQDIPPVTPRFTGYQYSHLSNPAGHAIREAAGVFGARGTTVRFVMMEGTWIFGHEDVEQLVPAAVIGPVPVMDPATAHHGLSGAAIVSATRNGYGMTGIADEVEARFMGVDLNGGIENTLAAALLQSNPGDVFLIVLAIQVPYLGPGSWVPFEFVQSAFDATLTCTALGRHVVVPAGNGNRSLDDPSLLGRFDRAVRDSGAIIVASSQGGLFQRAPYSNWGSRVDAHSWGDGVMSCGYGTLFFPNSDLQQAYTLAATGTSSSTPHLAGITCMLQGAAKRQLGQPLTNQQVVALLHAHGSTTPDVIGRRPDVVQMLAAIGAYDGLQIDAPDLDLTQTMTVTMSGPAGALAALFASFAPGDFDLGFNRRIHLDLSGLVSLGAFLLPAGSAQWSTTVPNNPALHGADLYFQAVRLAGTSPLHVTNSCQVTTL